MRELVGQHVEVTVRLKRRVKRVMPWTLADAPVGMLLRSKLTSGVWLVTEKDEKGVASCGRTWTYLKLHSGNMECSMDQGKTWKPCGREEEVWE